MDEKAASGDRIRRTRRALDLTQAVLAARVGVAPSTLIRIEKGRTRPNVDTLFKLADALGVDPKWILDGDRPKDAPEGG